MREAHPSREEGLPNPDEGKDNSETVTTVQGR
jgi:hypothetical protein